MNSWLKLVALATLCVFGLQVQAQLQWDPKPGIPNYGRVNGVAATLGNELYFGLGSIPDASQYSNELWAFDLQTQKWNQKASYPGGGRHSTAFFAIDGKLYVCGGTTYPEGPSNLQQDLYMYDPSTDSWTQKASFPGAKRYLVAAFVIDGKGYVGLGSGGGTTSYYDDFYKYDPVTNSWSRIADYPGGKCVQPAFFSLGGYGYVGVYRKDDANLYNNFYKYDPGSNAWTAIPSLPGGSRWLPMAFTLDSVAYVGGGRPGFARTHALNDFYKYSPATNSWTHFTSNDGFRGRWRFATYAVGDSAAYVGFGLDSFDFLTGLYQLRTSEPAYVDTIYVTVEDTLIIDLGTLSLGALCEGQQWAMYPNPATETLYIGPSSSSCVNGHRVELWDLQGTKLDGHTSTGGTSSFDLSGLSAGVYLVKFFNGTNEYAVKKVVIQR